MHRRSVLKQLALTTALAALCGVPAAHAADTVKVGVLHSLSGTMAISETVLKDVALMTFDEINASGGVMVSSANDILAECGKTVDDVDVYVPHQANKRIIDHAVGKLGVPPGRTVVNVDRFGNTSSGSIPLALADARADGRLHDGSLVLMTGMGAGLTWGSALLEWTDRRSA